MVSSHCQTFILLKTFTTYVRPKLEHNTAIWSPYFKKDITLLKTVQGSLHVTFVITVKYRLTHMLIVYLSLG